MCDFYMVCPLVAAPAFSQVVDDLKALEKKSEAFGLFLMRCKGIIASNSVVDEWFVDIYQRYWPSRIHRGSKTPWLFDQVVY